MPTYEVKLTSTATVRTSVTLDADNPKDARKRAVNTVLARDWDWDYDGCEKENIEVVSTIAYAATQT